MSVSDIPHSFLTKIRRNPTSATVSIFPRRTLQRMMGIQGYLLQKAPTVSGRLLKAVVVTALCAGLPREHSTPANSRKMLGISGAGSTVPRLGCHQAPTGLRA